MTTQSADTSLKPETTSMHLRWWPQVTALLLIIVELCWVVPWYRTVMQVSFVAPVPQAAFILGCVMLAGYGLAYFLESLRLLRSVQIGLLAGLLVLSLVLAEETLLDNPPMTILHGLVDLDPGAILVLFTVMWLWWRGVALARQAIRPMTAWRRFELGILLFMAHIFIVNHPGNEAPGLAWFMFFLFVGFLAVIFARVSFVGLSKGVTKNPFDRRWLLGTLSVLGSAVVISAFLGSLFTGQYRLVLQLLAEVFRLLVAVVLFVAAIPGLILSYALGPLVPWLRQFFVTQTAVPTEVDSSAYLPPEFTEQPRPVPLAVQSLIFWAVVLIIVVLIFVRLRRNMGRPRRENIDEPESLLRRGDAGKLLRKAVQDALDNLAAHLRPVQRAIVAARIRLIYIKLMALCADLNLPRPPAKTPLEFLPVMGELFSAVNPDLEKVTYAYVRIRYGEYPETRVEVDEIEAAWERIRLEGERLKKAGLGKLVTAEVKEIERPSV